MFSFFCKKSEEHDYFVRNSLVLQGEDIVKKPASRLKEKADLTIS